MTGLPQLFSELADEAKVYDVTERALRGARRRRRLRRAAVPAVAVMAVTAVVLAGLANRPQAAPVQPPPVSASPAAGFPKACVVQVLPVPAGYTYGLVTGGDPSGRRILGTLRQGDDFQPVIWVDGRAELFHLPGRWPNLRDMNSAGVVVGTSQVPDGKREAVSAAWAYQDGVFTWLKTSLTHNPAMTGSVAAAINDQGMIVGNINGLPVLWRSITAQPLFLPVRGGTFGNAIGIDNDGYIVGHMNRTALPMAHLWRPDGTLEELADADSFTGVAGGWVAGAVKDKAMRWNVHTKAAEQLDSRLLGLGPRVSRQGWVVDRTTDGLSLLVSDSGALILPPPAGHLSGPRYVKLFSDDGHTMAGGYQDTVPTGENPDVGTMPVVWHCS